MFVILRLAAARLGLEVELNAAAGNGFAERGRIGFAPALTLALGLGLTALVFVLARANVEDTEMSLLRERTSQTRGVVQTVVQQLEAIVAAGAAAAEYTDGDAGAFRDATGARVRLSLLSSLSLLRLEQAGPRLITSVGRNNPATLGKLSADGIARLREIARSGSDLTLVGVTRRDGSRVVAFAASTGARSVLVVYGEVTAPNAQAQAGGVESGDLRYAIYLGRKASPEALLLSSPGGGPTGDNVVTDVLRIGEERLFLALGPRGSLVGGFTRSFPWLTLAAGVMGSIALTTLVGTARRRRNKALRLVSDLERRTDELHRALAEQRRAEREARASAEKLAEAEETYRMLVERLPLVTYVGRLGEIGSPVYVSPQVEELLGYSVAEWLSDPALFVKLVHPEDREEVLADLGDGLESDPDHEPATEYRLIARDGQVVWVYANNVRVRDAEGRPVYSQGFLIDITGRKRLEEELRQAQRMEAVGRLAGGIAHDFNNVLVVIIGFANLLLKDFAADDPQREKAEQIARAGERAAELTQQLLAFSRRQVLMPQILDLNDVVTDMKLLLERLIGEDIRLEIVLDPELGKVQADPGQLEQVILNLVVNARDAMPTGGRLTIETTNLDVHQSHLAAHGNHSSGACVMLAISDSGHGMDESTRARAFDPFFTTKETGKGTGLGLATVYGIVTQSGGSIHIDSEPGRGTTFTMQLPRIDGSESAAAAAQPPQKDSLEGPETILLVEDDGAVRHLVRDVLLRHGYHVLVAASPREAVGIAEHHGGEIDLLLTDVVMPEMSGRELCETLTGSRPTIRTLYMSGYTDEALGHHGVLDESVALIGKPFTPVALVRRMRNVLEADETHVIGYGSTRGQ